MKPRYLGKCFTGVLVVTLASCGEQGEGEIVSTERSLTTTYQAENAFDIDEGVVETQHAGFTGTGYVNINNFSNTFMWHIVNAPVAGTATLRVRYANGGGTNRPIRITVNGATAATLSGAPTGAWTTWVTSGPVAITLVAGNNDVIHGSVTSDGMPNIDRFEIAQSFSQTIQAESAFDIDEGVVESQHAGFTGSGYVNIDNFSNTLMWHIVNSPVTGPATLVVRYANGAGTNRPIQISANGAAGGTINGAPTGAWTTWVTSAPIPITLVAGNNDVTHSSVTSDGMPNIDRFVITW